jgi:hypothetical protein
VVGGEAPLGREIPLTKAIAAVILMGLCSAASGYWLKPLIGDWRFLAEFAASAILVMGLFQLSFWRSVLALVIYWMVVVIAVLVLG